MRSTFCSRWLPLAVLAASIVLLGSATAADDKKDEGFTDLFNGKDFTGWKVFLQKNADPEKTYSFKDGVIICTGKPNGYFYTDKSYKNYVLRYDWLYARPEGLQDDEKFPGNSGALIHIQGEHKVWPRCIEVQGMNRDHGRILNVSGAKGDYVWDQQALKKVRKPVGQWNTTEIISKDGIIISKVNGKVIGAGLSELKEGPIGFQSEGAEIHFRNIKIKAEGGLRPATAVSQ
jgi:hypothetical protein